MKNQSALKKRLLLVDFMESSNVSVKTKYWVKSLAWAEEIWESPKLWMQCEFKAHWDFLDDNPWYSTYGETVCSLNSPQLEDTALKISDKLN